MAHSKMYYEVTWYDGNKDREKSFKHINEVHDFLNQDENKYLIQEKWFGLKIKEVRETEIDPQEIVYV